MTDSPAPDAAVQIATEGLCRNVRLIELRDYAREVVAALARGGWLHDPKRVAALEAVAAAARGALDVDPTAGSEHAERHMRLESALDALDAAQAGTAAEGAIDEGVLHEWGLRWPNGEVNPVVATRERAEHIAARDATGHTIVSRTVMRSPWKPAAGTAAEGESGAGT
jgi:hypothetical protein